MRLGAVKAAQQIGRPLAHGDRRGSVVEHRRDGGEVGRRIDHRQGPHRVRPGLVGKILPRDDLLQVGLHVAKIEVAHRVNAQRDLAWLHRGQQPGGQARREAARLFVERRASFLSPLLDHLEQLELLGRPAFRRVGEAHQGRHRRRHSIAGDVMREAEQPLLRLVVLLEMGEQKGGRLRTVHAGGDIRNVPQVALVQIEPAQRQPDIGRLQLISQRHPRHVDQMGVVGRGVLQQDQERPDVIDVGMSAQHLGRGTAHESVGVGNPVKNRLLEWPGQGRAVDEHLEAVHAQLAVGVARAGDQEAVVEPAQTVEHPEARGRAVGPARLGS